MVLRIGGGGLVRIAGVCGSNEETIDLGSGLEGQFRDEKVDVSFHGDNGVLQ